MTEDNKFNVGDIVLALAGRDSERLFIIVGIIDENYVYIADGKSRKADSPKKKKIKHIELVKKSGDINDLFPNKVRDKNGKFTNSGLRKIISEIKAGENQNK